MTKIRMAVVAAATLAAVTSAVSTHLHAASAQSAAAPACAIGTPTSRSVEHTFQRLSMAPGPFHSVGYMTYVRGLGVDDLFDVAPGAQAAATNESNARFTHVEHGQLIHTIPNSFAPPRKAN